MFAMPTTSRDFLRAANRRFAAAEFLAGDGYNTDGMYLAGYCIECSLKALILKATSGADRPITLQRITQGKAMHDFEILARILRDKGITIPSGYLKRLRRSRWSTALRYESDREDSGETRAFLKTAQAVYN